MMKKVINIFILTGFAILVISCSLFQKTAKDDTPQSEEKGDILLTVGDDEVTAEEFMNIYNKNNINNDNVDKKSIDEYLDLYITFKLKVKEARDLGMDTVDSFVKELDGYREQLAEPYFIDEKVNEDLLKTAYERMQTDIRASHILIKLDQSASPKDTLAAYNKIIELRDRIINGEDFGAVAEAESDDISARDRPAQQGRPARKGNHGDLGYFSVFDMIYPFEEAVYHTEVGDISTPVRTIYGYHIIKVTDKQPALGRAQVAHIYLSFPNSPKAEDSINNEAKINEVYQKLQNGEEWNTLVTEYSNDKGSIEKGGVLPWFGANRMVPEFIHNVKLLQDSGQYSPPILTMFGWHIIQLKERKTPGSYEEEKENLKRRLIKDARANKSKEAVIKQIKKEYGYKDYGRDNLDELYATVDTTILQNQWKSEKARKLNKPLFQIGDEVYSQNDYAVYLEKKQIQRGIKPPETFFFDLYEDYTDEMCIDYEDANLENKYPEFRLLMQEYRDGILLFNLMDKRVWSKAVQDTTGLKEFYQNIKDKYMWEDERLLTTIYIVNPETDPDKVKEEAKAGTETAMIKKKFNSGDKKNNVFIDEEVFIKGDNALIDELSWAKGITQNYQIIDYPAFKSNNEINDGAMFFIRINDVRGPEPKSLDEIRGIATSEYQKYLEEEWIEILNGKYEVIINEEVLSKIKNQ